ISGRSVAGARANIGEFRVFPGNGWRSVPNSRSIPTNPASARLNQTAEEDFVLALEDKFDDIKKLIDAGKEKGYLTYDEANELIPHDVHSPEDLDDLLTTIGTQGIDLLEGQPKLPSAQVLEKRFEQEVEAGED